MDETTKVVTDPVPTDVAEGITAVEELLDGLTAEEVVAEETVDSTDPVEAIPAEGEAVEPEAEITTESGTETENADE